MHEVRAELVAAARHAAGRAYRADFSGPATVLVGDTPLDVEAALATGARAVAVATGSYPAADLAAAGAHVVLPDLTDTARVVAAVTAGDLPARRRQQAALDSGGHRRGAAGHAQLAERAAGNPVITQRVKSTVCLGLTELEGSVLAWEAPGA